MPTNQLSPPESSALPLINLPADLSDKVKVSTPTDEDMNVLAGFRSNTGPWKERGEDLEGSLEALTKLRPFVHVAKIDNQTVGYFTIERDGPVPGAAYLRNLVVKADLRRRGVGHQLMARAFQEARDTLRKTIALRVDPANADAVSFFRKEGFTTVQTVISKKNGKLRLLMSKDL